MKTSNETLMIHFLYSTFSRTVFEAGTFSNINRPTELYFDLDRITYLEEHVFLKFLEENDKNMIFISEHIFDCNDCRNYWLAQKSGIADQVTHMKCSNGKYLKDSSNFELCKIE